MSQKKTKKTKEVEKKFSLKEARQIVVNDVKIPGDLDNSLKKLCDNILPKYLYGKGKEKETAQKQFQDVVIEAMFSLETETHAGLMASFSQQYRGMAKEMTIKLIKENSCDTHTEKMLAEVIANSFVRTIENSKRLNGCMDVAEYISDERTRYLTYLSKQIDRSHRQYLTALTTLKQLKAPSIEMNIKTTNAFVAHNQQINAQNETNENK